MTKVSLVAPQFQEVIPEHLVDGELYVSMEHATVVHRCCCGCGSEVVTPLTPDDWQLTFDGESVTLYPSIGNWSFKCRSHYWIRQGRVVWARKWSDAEVAKARMARTMAPVTPAPGEPASEAVPTTSRRGLSERILGWLRWRSGPPG